MTVAREGTTESEKNSTSGKQMFVFECVYQKKQTKKKLCNLQKVPERVQKNYCQLKQKSTCKRDISLAKSLAKCYNHCEDRAVM